MKNFSVAIIGGGIVGANIFDLLTINGVKTVLIEKGEDVSLGATKANSGIIHAGYDAMPNTLKAKFNVQGNKMYDAIAKRIGENINHCGSLVISDAKGKAKLEELLNRGKKNGVKGLSILDREHLEKIEPHLNKKIKYGLFAKTAKIISPYHFCIALCEEAIINGGELKLNYDITSVKKEDNHYIISNGKEEICAEYVINCAGAGLNEVNKLFGEKQVPLKFVKGEYILLDNSEKNLVHRPIFPLPTKKGKGILVCPTIHGNIFLGPTAVDIKEFDTSFSYDSLSTIKSQVVDNVDGINFKKVIKLYAGVRVISGGDFKIEFSTKNKNYCCIAGICSPGLSAAPAIAKYVMQELKYLGLQTQKIKLVKRKPYTNILTMKESNVDKLIKTDANYGEIVCNCEKISKGEILEVLNGPMKVMTTDGVKRRLRTTMGHCQGSFCYPKLVKIMSEFYNVEENEINMRGNTSLVTSNIKEGGLYE